MAALEQVSEITGSPVVNIVGLCLGGTMATIAWLNLAAKDEAARVGLDDRGPNTLVDFSIPGNLGVFADRKSVTRLEQNMAASVAISKRPRWRRRSKLASGQRPWSGNYVVNNWYSGARPHAFDLLAWNGDSTNMPAAMHTQYLRACYVDTC